MIHIHILCIKGTSIFILNNYSIKWNCKQSRNSLNIAWEGAQLIDFVIIIKQKMVGAIVMRNDCFVGMMANDFCKYTFSAT